MLTKKFSQFQGPSPIQDGDIVVGLRIAPDGVLDNWQFTGVGSGGGGSDGTTTVITQIPNTLMKGQWVRVDLTGQYVVADGTTPELAETVGVVFSIVVPGETFTVKQSGYIKTSDAVFVGLFPGNPYYLDTVVPGNMVNTDVQIDGQVSKPVFIPDTPTSGWVVPLMRGLVLGGNFSGGIPVSDSNIVTVTQPNSFAPGNWLRLSVPFAGHVNYVLAQANTLANAQCVGTVISATPTTFVLQFAGYNVGAVTHDEVPAALTPSTVYYLSATNAGEMTSVDPGLTGGISKPLFVSEQTTATVSVNAGYILPQRPLNSVSDNPFASPPIFLGNLDSGNTWSDANIFNNNGGPFGSYIMTFNPNVINGHGLSAVGPNPISIGFQFAAGGVFSLATTYQCTLSGVNNSAGLGVATFWGHIEDTSSPRNVAYIFPNIAGETGTRVAISYMSATLIDNRFGGGMSMIGTYYCTDWSVGNVPTNHNFTSTGQSAGPNGGGVGVFTSGIRLVFDGVGAAIFDGTTGYFSIWGIPNS